MMTAKKKRRKPALEICVSLRVIVVAWVMLFPITGLTLLRAEAPKALQEEGEFKIVVNGSDIGSEKFLIASSGDSTSSTSVLEFRNPSNRSQKVKMESKLEMGLNYLAKDYVLTSDVDGEKGQIHAEFSARQVMFDLSGSRTGQRSGLLLGEEYTVLDTNIFHHYIFLTRLFDSGNREKTRRFEVVIPQEQDNGKLTLTDMGNEPLSIKGKKTEVRRILVDSGAVQINLWVDREGILQKIGVPSKGIEVLRVK
jgi:hypothetical protein